MNTKAVTAIIIAVIIIGLGAYFGLKKPEGSSNISPSEDSTPTAQDQEESSKRMESMRDLLASGESKECRFSREDTQGTMSGTVYLSDGKMRGNFMMSGQSTGSVEMHTINDGEYTYTWGGFMGANQGTKIKTTALAGGTDTVPNQNQTFDYDQQMEFDCDEWRTDNSQFNPPSDIVFTDLSVQIQQMQQPQQPQNQASQDTAERCAACDQVPSSSRAQCRAALGC